jgi:hypothetical protein
MFASIGQASFFSNGGKQAGHPESQPRIDQKAGAERSDGDDDLPW